MSRSRTALAILAPTVLAGGLIASMSTITRADEQDDARAAREEARRAREEARQEAQRARDEQKQAMKEALKALKTARRDAREQLAEARRQVASSPLPDDVKERLLEHLERIAERVDQHIDQAAQSGDIDQLGQELGEMGREIGEMGREIGEEMAEWAKHFDGQQGHWDNQDFDFDFDFDPPTPPTLPTPPTAPTPPVPPAAPTPAVTGDLDLDLSDLDAVIALDDFQLAPQQVESLQDIYADEQEASEPAREAIAELSRELRGMLEDPNADEREVLRLIDQISREEAQLRKAQVQAWMRGRRVLDAGQRAKVEKARDKVKIKAKRGRNK